MRLYRTAFKTDQVLCVGDINMSNTEWVYNENDADMMEIRLSYEQSNDANKTRKCNFFFTAMREAKK